MTIVCIDPQKDPRWYQLVDQHHSSAFHTPGWMQVLSDTYGLEIKAYVLLNDCGEPVAGLPFCRVSDIRGTRIITLPFSDYCDPLVANSEEWCCLIDEILKEQHPVIVRCVHNNVPLLDDRFTIYKQAAWHGCDLRPDLDTLWHGLHSSARRAIRKAESHGVVAQVAQGKEELRAFFQMHLRVRKYKYHLLAQPYRFFENIWREFIDTQNGLLIVAVHQGEIIGGVLFLTWKDGLYYKFNASVAEELPFRPNDLLIWEGIKYGKAQGYTHLDFGLSDLDQEGLIQYKRKFASQDKTIRFLRYGGPAGAADEQTAQLQHLLPQMTSLFTDKLVPDEITEMAGELLYRYFI